MMSANVGIEEANTSITRGTTFRTTELGVSSEIAHVRTSSSTLGQPRIRSGNFVRTTYTPVLSSVTSAAAQED
jgi:hypothetical protein